MFFSKKYQNDYGFIRLAKFKSLLEDILNALFGPLLVVGKIYMFLLVSSRKVRWLSRR